MENETIEISTREFDDNIILDTLHDEVSKNIFISNKRKTNNYMCYDFGLSIPKFIYDEDGDATLKYLSVSNVFSAIAKKSNNSIKLECPIREEISEKYLNKKATMIDKIENILMSSIYDRIVDIPKVQTGLNPIKEVLNTVHNLGELKISDFYTRRKYKKNSDNYIKFLESLGFIAIENGIMYPGNEMIKYDLGEYNKEFNNTILQEIIKNGHEFIKQFLRIQILTPYLELSSSYYLPAHYAKKLIQLNHHQIGEYYYDMYPNTKPKPNYILHYNLTELKYAGILKIKNNNFYGFNNIFNKFNEAIPNDMKY
jgi:hypothetical protein